MVAPRDTVPFPRGQARQPPGPLGTASGVRHGFGVLVTSCREDRGQVGACTFTHKWARHRGREDERETGGLLQL